MDAGSGTGILTLAALEEVINKEGITWVLAVDIDYNASMNTRINLIDNDLYQYADVITANLLDTIKAGFRIDIVISNPPYLPGNWSEDWRIFGGPHGNEVTRSLIQLVCQGRVRMVILTQSSLSNWEDLIGYLGSCGFKLIIFKATHYFF
nr:methyltransferase [Vulcanisaeta sp. JCM 16159]